VPGIIQSVERAAAILRTLAVEVEPVPLASVALAVDLPKATVHGLLRTLVDVGFVDQDPTSGGYLLGADVLTLGSERIDPNELRSRALNWTDALAARTGEAVRLAALSCGSALVVHHVFRTDTPGQTIETGARLPLHATALGKVLLAFDPAAVRSLPSGALESFTFRTSPDRSTLLRQLADVRDRGWAASVDEHLPGVAEIAAAVRDQHGSVVAAVGVVGDVDRVCDAALRPRDDIVGETVAVGRSISRELGHGREP
jgi:DNA-binding IclR family transcriptional regulator